MEFRPASIAYDFRHEFKAAFRLTATMNPGGIPIHFEAILVNSAYDKKVKTYLHLFLVKVNNIIFLFFLVKVFFIFVFHDLT